MHAANILKIQINFYKILFKCLNSQEKILTENLLRMEMGTVLGPMSQACEDKYTREHVEGTMVQHPRQSEGLDLLLWL